MSPRAFGRSSGEGPDAEWQRFTPAERLTRWAVYFVLVMALVWAVRSVEFIPEFLIDAPEQLLDLLTRMWRPDLGYYRPAVHVALVETLHIASLGMLFSFIFAVPLALLAARNICPYRWLNSLAQLLLATSRSMNSLGPVEIYLECMTAAAR